MSYPVLVQELQLDLDVRSEFLEILLLALELFLRLSLTVLVHLGLGRRRVELQVRPVGVVLHPAAGGEIKLHCRINHVFTCERTVIHLVRHWVGLGWFYYLVVQLSAQFGFAGGKMAKEAEQTCNMVQH